MGAAVGDGWRGLAVAHVDPRTGDVHRANPADVAQSGGRAALHTDVAEPVPGEATGDTVPGESLVGFQMFTRDDKGPHLTDAGESFRNRIAPRALRIRDSIAALHLQQRAQLCCREERQKH